MNLTVTDICTKLFSKVAHLSEQSVKCFFSNLLRTVYDDAPPAAAFVVFDHAGHDGLPLTEGSVDQELGHPR